MSTETPNANAGRLHQEADRLRTRAQNYRPGSPDRGTLLRLASRKDHEAARILQAAACPPPQPDNPTHP